ncbi:hypothetical protein [Sporomusa sp.]|uniref:hypothetical protein n=1 Tax=Sporomusa sp. TaxID=2078658 RepID=UPI002D0A7970|nr:hypothetical protein [Sporomusa sp.]HWR43715.1 hypothetical protein [Sporomusa sp.]
MKFAIAEKLHEKYLEEVVTAISQDGLWRKKLFEGHYDERFLITFKELEELPCQLWTTFCQYGLEFFVSKIYSCPEGLDEGLIIFEFKAKGFPHLVSQVKVSAIG